MLKASIQLCSFIKEHNLKPESTQLKRREQIVNIKLGLLSKEKEDERYFW